MVYQVYVNVHTFSVAVPFAWNGLSLDSPWSHPHHLQQLCKRHLFFEIFHDNPIYTLPPPRAFHYSALLFTIVFRTIKYIIYFNNFFCFAYLFISVRSYVPWQQDFVSSCFAYFYKPCVYDNVRHAGRVQCTFIVLNKSLENTKQWRSIQIRQRSEQKLRRYDEKKIDGA